MKKNDSENLELHDTRHKKGKGACDMCFPHLIDLTFMHENILKRNKKKVKFSKMYTFFTFFFRLKNFNLD